MSTRCRPGIIAVGVNSHIAGYLFSVEERTDVPDWVVLTMAPGAWWWCRSLQDTQIVGANLDTGQDAIVGRGALVRLPDSWLQPIGDAPVARALDCELEAA